MNYKYSNLDLNDLFLKVFSRKKQKEELENFIVDGSLSLSEREEILKTRANMIKEIVDEERLLYEKINIYYKRENGKLLDVDLLDDKDELFNWISDKCRYDSLNILLGSLTRHFNSITKFENDYYGVKDSFFAKNLDVLLRMILRESPLMFKNDYSTKTELTKISKNQVDDYMTEMLIQIDPSLEWLNMYLEARKDGKIIDVKTISDLEKENLAQFFQTDIEDIPTACVQSKAVDPFIILNFTGTIFDVVALMHEFVHYVTFSKNKNLKYKVHASLSEFPSIFFELYATRFFENKGFSIGEVNALNEERKSYCFDVYNHNKYVFLYLLDYLETGKVTEENDIKKHQILSLNMTKNSDLIDNISDKEMECLSDLKVLAKKHCDETICKILDDSIYQTYYYLFSGYIADKAFEECDDSIVDCVKRYAENIELIDSYDLFKSLGFDVDTLGLKKGYNPVVKGLKKVKRKYINVKKDVFK